MKRAVFLSGAAALAGCGGGGHTGSVLPSTANSVAGNTSTAGAATTGATTTAPTSKAQLIPATPDTVAQTTLDNPIIGQAVRYGGATAPAKWIFAQGQTLSVGAYPGLFAVLGSIAGGDGKTTFGLPNAPGNLMIATQGALITTPQQLARHIPPGSTTLAGMRSPAPALPKPVPAELTASRALIANAMSYGTGTAPALDSDMRTRIASAKANARDLGAEQLSSAARAFVSSAIDDAANGRTSIAGAVTRIAQSLGASEAAGVLAVHDAMTNAFVSRGPQNHEVPQLEAARFLVSVTMTRAQTKSALRFGD